jgi:hypothetical protein
LRRNRDSKIQLHNFEKGDFVLVGTSKRKDKLEARWKGPFRIVNVINDSVFQVEDVLTNSVKEVHSVRLRPYNDRDLNSSVKEYIQRRGTREVLVRWRGFDEDEATWEPLDTILEDVPQLYREFRRSRQLVY